jgi:hypothetical protein
MQYQRIHANGDVMVIEVRNHASYMGQVTTKSGIPHKNKTFYFYAPSLDSAQSKMDQYVTGSHLCSFECGCWEKVRRLM